MATQSSTDASLTVEQMGGIAQQTISFEEGTTLLAGENATGRSSLLQALLVALGSDAGSVRVGADTGQVELSLGDTTYTRTITKTDDAITVTGVPYLEDPEAVQHAETYACLLETNPIRRAVRNGADGLRKWLMQPVDADAIERRLQGVREDLRDQEARRDALQEQAAQLSSLEARRDELADEVGSLTDRIEDLEARIEAVAGEIEATEHDDVGTALHELEDARAQLEDARQERAQAVHRLEQHTQDHDAVTTRLEELKRPDTSLEDLEQRRDQIIADIDRVEAAIRHLADLAQWNAEFLGDTERAFQLALPPIEGAGTDDGDHEHSATDEIADGDGDMTTCWTCGQSVARTRIEATIDQLRAQRHQYEARREDLEAELDEVEDHIETLRATREEYDRLTERRAELEEAIAREERVVERIETRIDEHEATIAGVTDRLEDAEVGGEQAGDLVDLHEQAAALREERERRQQDLAEIDEKIEDAEAAQDAIPAVEDRIGALQAERESLTERIDQREREVVEACNEQFGAILDALEYTEIERIWLERQGPAGVQSGTEHERGFELHVEREHEGELVTDQVGHLSESEREVVGIIMALAGYLAHGIDEIVPFVVLDSVDVFDAPRLGALLGHVGEYATYTICAALPSAVTDGVRAQADTLVWM